MTCTSTRRTTPVGGRQGRLLRGRAGRRAAASRSSSIGWVSGRRRCRGGQRWGTDIEGHRMVLEMAGWGTFVAGPDVVVGGLKE